MGQWIQKMGSIEADPGGMLNSRLSTEYWILIPFWEPKLSVSTQSTHSDGLPLRGVPSRGNQPATSDQKYTGDVQYSKSHINLIWWRMLQKGNVHRLQRWLQVTVDHGVWGFSGWGYLEGWRFLAKWSEGIEDFRFSGLSMTIPHVHSTWCFFPHWTGHSAHLQNLEAFPGKYLSTSCMNLLKSSLVIVLSDLHAFFNFPSPCKQASKSTHFQQLFCGWCCFFPHNRLFWSKSPATDPQSIEQLLHLVFGPVPVQLFSSFLSDANS